MAKHMHIEAINADGTKAGEVILRGYALTHNPNVYGVYLQCDEVNYRKALAALDPALEWRLKRYGKSDKNVPIINFE